jgi:hypothetical protein
VLCFCFELREDPADLEAPLCCVVTGRTGQPSALCSVLFHMAATQHLCLPLPGLAARSYTQQQQRAHGDLGS